MKTPLVAVLALMAAAPVAPQRRTAWSEFVRAFDAYAASDSIVGASVALLQGSRVTARHDFGWQDRAAREPADSNTIYHWASITKTLTAVAVLQLRDRGKLSLDDRVTRYLPELRQVHDSFGAIDAITIGMLLSHSGGFQSPTWPWGEGKPWEPFEPTRWEQLVAMMPYTELEFRPGSRYGYSNPAFIYLARIIEQLTGDEWQTYVQKNILTPLGMTRSYFGGTPYHLERYRSNNYTVRAAEGGNGRQEVVDNGPDFDPGVTIPNGGWNAPLGDLIRWLAFLTGAGDQRVLARGSLEEMWRARFLAVEPVAGVEMPSDSMGLSFFILWRHGRRFVGHTGSQAGFRSFFYIDPVTRRAVVAAFNTSNSAQWERSSAGFRTVRDQALGLIATP